MTLTIARRIALVAVLAALGPIAATRALAAEGELRWGLHVTLAAKWLDPAETEAFNTPYMNMYPVHDALVQPLPAGPPTPRPAEAWPASPDHLTYTFPLRDHAQP